MTDDAAGELSAEELADLRVRLERLDRRSSTAWTRTTLALIAKYPGVTVSALARQAGHDRGSFKVNVRQLDDIGLTERSGTGYRLSPLGEALLRALS